MKLTTWKKAAIVISLGLALLTAASMSRAADDQSARAAVDQVAQLFSSKSSIATVKMEIVNADGQRALSMRIWSLGDDVLIRITSPQNEAGTAILKEGSDIWYYLPKTDRTVKVPASMATTSWMGSDFTIDDLVKEKFLTRDYSVSTSFIGTRGGIAVHEYTLTPKPNAAIVWGKVVLQIRQADSVPTWQGFYDEDGQLIRELSFSDYKKMSGRVIPTRMVMRSAKKPGAETTIEYDDIAFNVPVARQTFSLPNLK